MQGHTTEKAFETYVEEILTRGGAVAEWGKEGALRAAVLRFESFRADLSKAIYESIPA